LRPTSSRALHAGEVLLAVEFDQQLALLDVVAFLDGQAGDLGADVGADVDLGVRLDLAGGVDLLHDLRALDRHDLDFLCLVVLAVHDGEAAGAQRDHDRDCDDDQVAFLHGRVPRLRFSNARIGPRTATVLECQKCCLPMARSGRAAGRHAAAPNSRSGGHSAGDCSSEARGPASAADMRSTWPRVNIVIAASST
jgi:hypothetical protein